MNKQTIAQPTLHLLVGLPGSGKSTFRNNLSGVVLSTDDYLESRAKLLGIPYNELFNVVGELSAANKNLNLTFDFALNAKQDIIWDQTNLTKKSRVRKLTRVPKEYKKIAYVFNPDFLTILARNHERVAKGRDIPYNHLSHMKRIIEFPTLDEGFDKIIFID